MTKLEGERWIFSEERRVRDRKIAAVLLPVGAVVGGVAAAATCLTDRGVSPFFTQKRIGKFGSTFNIYKIRTMPAGQIDGPSLGPADPRATAIGKTMRRFGIDEIPQLINVFNGDLGLFGPRALLAQDIEGMQQSLPRTLFEEWWETYECGPGLASSFGIMSHKLGDDLPPSFEMRAKLDIYDHANASSMNDWRILARVAQPAGRIAALVA